MNNEIKEILDIMKKCYDLKDENFDNYITLYQLGLLLDYITNLQQENGRLKERVAYLERSNNRREDTIIGLRFEVAEQEDYKSRCEKAIPILNNIYMLDNVTITNNACEEIDKAINTLQNGSDDNVK